MPPWVMAAFFLAVIATATAKGGAPSLGIAIVGADGVGANGPAVGRVVAQDEFLRAGHGCWNGDGLGFLSGIGGCRCVRPGTESRLRLVRQFWLVRYS